jgi:hypothetical protein
MKFRPLLTCFSLFSFFCGYCQTDVLLVPRGILLPPDSLTRVELLGSLRGWLGGPQRENGYILADDRPAISALMDEMRGLEKKVVGVGDTSFYKCYLTNVVPVDSGEFRVQLAYMGVKGAERGVGGEAVPELRACCTVLARQRGDKFYFSSPLGENTVGWKTRQIGNCQFHYKKGINMEKAAAYQKKLAFYDKKLGMEPQIIDFYCCDNLPEAIKLVGLEYKADYNGLSYEELSGFSGNRSVVLCGFVSVDGFNDWDPHDTWHMRLHNVVAPATINRPVDEACAYLYGGSWRIYQPEDVLRLFGEYAAAHPDADWLALYKAGTNFIPPPKILKISYAINALIVRQLEKDKGFPAVLELLTCGKKEQGDGNYFAAVRRLTGVDEAGYNGYVWRLIRNQ